MSFQAVRLSMLQQIERLEDVADVRIRPTRIDAVERLFEDVQETAFEAGRAYGIKQQREAHDKAARDEETIGRDAVGFIRERAAERAAAMVRNPIHRAWITKLVLGLIDELEQQRRNETEIPF